MKIIQTYKFKKHMEAHNKEFLIPYQELLEYAIENDLLKCNGEELCKLTVEFPFTVGYCNLIQTRNEDEIVYAKRIGRDGYTRLVLNRTPEKVNKCVFILNRNRNNDNEYYLITVFPGEYCVKEPQDKHIQDQEELEESLNFWGQYAIIYQEDIIDKDTLIRECPFDYDELLLKMSSVKKNMALA